MPCTLIEEKAYVTLGYITKSIASMLGRWPFLYSQHWQDTSRVLCLGLGSPAQGDMDFLEWLQWRDTKMIKAEEHLPHKERMEELGLFNVEKKRLRSMFLMCIHTWWKRRWIQALFSDISWKDRRGNGHKLKYRKFQANMRKSHFTMRMVKHLLALSNCPEMLRIFHFWINAKPSWT